MDRSKIENLDVVAATLTSAYILKTTNPDKFDFEDYETYINIYLGMRAELINTLEK